MQKTNESRMIGKLFFFSFVSLLLTACNDTGKAFAIADINGRPVATVYKITTGAFNFSPIACRRAPAQNADTMIHLYAGTLVDLVSVEEGMLKRDNSYWLHVYPPLSHRPSCYIDVRYLVPYS